MKRCACQIHLLSLLATRSPYGYDASRSFLFGPATSYVEGTLSHPILCIVFFELRGSVQHLVSHILITPAFQVFAVLGDHSCDLLSRLSPLEPRTVQEA